ncbi:hypothetical protein HSBAA_PA_1820 (plasmid) [Vreelandella sulfidaeris]|uniref:Uncharacterized protein n=1 Tax=Vreelandella sulfidaeris TaxID=115553 RepID=A0A455UMT4_9GAMM|nr:hypothetical protein HSBAA_PA_1820 [Halomonas sulfidaeris]
MKDQSRFSELSSMSRRRFLVTTGSSTLASYLMLNRPAWALNADVARSGNFGELDATAEEGIDLYLENQDLLIGGRVGRGLPLMALSPDRSSA